MAMDLSKEKVTCDVVGSLSKLIWDTISQAGYPAEKNPSETNAQYAVRSEFFKKLSFTIASSVISYVKTNADVTGVEVSGTVESYITGVGDYGGSLPGITGNVKTSGLGQGTNKGKVS